MYYDRCLETLNLAGDELSGTNNWPVG